jgi:hypothetical protein
MSSRVAGLTKGGILENPFVKQDREVRPEDPVSSPVSIHQQKCWLYGGLTYNVQRTIFQVCLLGAELAYMLSILKHSRLTKPPGTRASYYNY